MAVFLAVANRKGGVGKSTVTTMLAHSLSVWGLQRVLVLDLDTQANASVILFGGQNWLEAKNANKTIANYIFDTFYLPDVIRHEGYVFPTVSDVLDEDGNPPPISLVPGSLDLEDRERELLHYLARENESLPEAEKGVIARISRLLLSFGRHFDIVIMDCPPGVSFSTQAALAIAHKVIVPFRPDYVSHYAVDRISQMIEGKPFPEVLKIPPEARRYVAVANFWRETASHRTAVAEIEADHPCMAHRIPQAAPIAAAFDWQGNRSTLKQKYGKGLDSVIHLYNEILPIVTAAMAMPERAAS